MDPSFTWVGDLTSMPDSTRTNLRFMARAVSRLLSIAVMIAKGIVWVLPVRLPANMMVAPNSDKARAQARAIPDSRDGMASGRDSRQKVHQGEIPRVWDASS